MLDGDNAYRYAWKIFDATVNTAMVGTTYAVSTWWLAALVFAFGLWNYIDGQVRARWYD